MNEPKIIDIDRIDAQIDGLKSNWELDFSMIDEDFLIECLEDLKRYANKSALTARISVDVREIDEVKNIIQVLGTALDLACERIRKEHPLLASMGIDIKEHYIKEAKKKTK